MSIANSNRRIATICCLFASMLLAPIARTQQPSADDGSATITVSTGTLKVDADGTPHLTFDEPIPGATITLTPIDDPAGGTSATTDAKDNVDFKGLKPGIYKVKVVARGKTFVYHIKVDRGQTTNQALGNAGPPSEDSTPDTATIDKLVKAANDAVQACDKAAYEKAINALYALGADLEQDLSRLKDLIEAAQKTNGGLPDDISKLTDRLAKSRAILANPYSLADVHDSGAPLDPQNGINLILDFMHLVQERDRVKAELDAVEAGEKKIKPLPASCTPPKTTPPETPPKTVPSDKPLAPPDSDKPNPKSGD